MNLGETAYELFAHNLRDGSERVALVDCDDAITYGQLERRVARIAEALRRRGIVRGERVVVHLRKSIDEVAAQLACWRLGAVAVNVSRQWTVAQLRYVVDDCSVAAVVGDGARARELIATPGGAPTVVVLDDPFSDPHVVALPEVGGGVPVERIVDRDLAAIVYTSGSTGSPKGVMLSHQNLVLGARSVAAYLDIAPDDRLLGLLPLCFDYGLNQLLTTWLVGATLVLQAVPMPAEIAATVRREGVTGIAAVPPIWVQLVRFLDETRTTLPSLRYVTNSGGKIPPAILERMPAVLDGVDIVSMYGFTEAFRSTFLPPARFREKPGSIGRAIPNAEVFVVDPERGLCGPGEEGELVHRGSLVSLGYWGRRDDTAEKIHPCPALAHLIGDEPVAWSGDVVRIDADGDLWFVGRRDGMIKSSGFRISPTEIEDIVHDSGVVTEVVAFGVEDDRLGQAVHLAVGTGGRTHVDLDVLRRHNKARMPHYMLPRVIHPWNEPMPRTASGKLDRPSIEARCRARASAGS